MMTWRHIRPGRGMIAIAHRGARRVKLWGTNKPGAQRSGAPD
jgi:hypothetical protein